MSASAQQLGTWIGMVVLAAVAFVSERRAKRASDAAHTKVDQRAEEVNSALKKVEDTSATAHVVANSAFRTAEDAKRMAAEYERMTAMVVGTVAQNDDLRQSIRDLKYELSQVNAREARCQDQLITMAREKAQLATEVNDLRNQVTGFAGQVAQLTSLVNQKDS